jgi:hypothetical protein
MTTDLLPSMNFPYVIVYTTYIGATPEQVESEVTRPMESAFATLTDIKNINSQSSDNLSLVIMEFNDTADMNTAMIEINSEITTLSAGWSDSVSAPAIMKINPDMLPVSIVSVAREGMDIYELSEYVENELIPEYEAINGVASVTASGLISQQILPLILIVVGLMLVILVPIFYRLRFAQHVIMDGERSAMMAMRFSRLYMKGNCLKLLKLDLSFWWYYAASFALSLVFYGSELLGLAGVSLPWSTEAGYAVSTGLYMVGLLVLNYFFLCYTEATYAHAYYELKPHEVQVV